jgi:hypothetical protein
VADQPVPVGEDVPLFEVTHTMRAMRRLKPGPVPDELLERLVEAATWAPSGSNAQASRAGAGTGGEHPGLAPPPVRGDPSGSVVMGTAAAP